MQVDWRIGTLIIVAVVAVILLAALAGPGIDRGTAVGSGGPPACPPGHLTNGGCAKP